MNELLSINQTKASPKMSSRYVHVNTMDVIDVMTSAGFSVAETKSDTSKKHGSEFLRHMVIFRNDNVKTTYENYVPQMLWINSHNGTCPATMRLGIYRFVCANGLVVGNDFESERIRHTGDLARQVIDRVKTLSLTSAKVFSQIESWSKIDLSKDKRIEFAQKATEIRFGTKANQYAIDSILGVRRSEDDKGDLWSVFNRVQENTVKGGLVGRNANNRQIMSRKLTAISAELSYNQKLWELATEYA